MKIIYMDDTITLLSKILDINILCATGVVKHCNEKPYLLIIKE